MSFFFFYLGFCILFSCMILRRGIRICPLFKSLISLYNLILYTVLFCYLKHLLIFLLVMVNIKPPAWKHLFQGSPEGLARSLMSCSDSLQIKVLQEMRMNEEFHPSLIFLKYIFSFSTAEIMSDISAIL